MELCGNVNIVPSYRAPGNKRFGWVLTKESGSKAFATLAKTLGDQARAVLGYFRHGLTSGVIEGINSKITKIQFQMRGRTNYVRE